MMTRQTMTSSNPMRRPRHKRARHPQPMREGENDRNIVRLLYDYRVLSQRQLERLLGRARSTVQRLLRRLYDHRYVDRLFLPIAEFGSSPALYILDQRGIDLLRRMGVEDVSGVPGKSLSGMFLEHTQAINDFRIALTLHCHQRGWTMTEWHTENQIKADYDRVKIRSRPEPVALVPDGYFGIHVPERGGTAYFFLELDRGSMTLDRFREKVEAYVISHHAGGYQRRFGHQGFRVLTVVAGVGRGRVRNLCTTTGRVPRIGRRFWFTHLADTQLPGVLDDPIWTVAGEATPVSLF